MEEKKVDEVKNQRVASSNEKHTAMNKRNNRGLIVTIVVLIIILISGGVYFGFIKKDNNQPTNNGNNNNIDGAVVYKSKDGEEIKLLKYGTPKLDESGRTVETYYRLYKDNNMLEVIEEYWDRYKNGKFIVSNEHIWYLLDENSKEIIASYSSNDTVRYFPQEMSDYDNKEYCVIVSTFDLTKETSTEKVIMAVNTINNTIIKLESNSLEKYMVNKSNLYLRKGNKVYQYDVLSGELKKSEEYSNIIDTSFGDFTPLVILKNNNYYFVDVFDSFKETKLNKLDTYTNDNEKMEMFKLDNDKYFYYENKANGDKIFHQLAESSELDKEDDNYAVYTAGGGMCGANIMVNKKAKKLEGYESNYDFEKGSKGYYFFHGECVTDWGRTYAYTTSWKKIGESFIMNSSRVDSNGNLYVANSGLIELRDINGELVEKSKDYKEIGGGLTKDNILYAVVRDNKKVYLVSLNSKLEEISKIEINTTTYEEFFPYLELKNGKIEISITNSEGSESVFNYDISSKKLTKVENN